MKKGKLICFLRGHQWHETSYNHSRYACCRCNETGSEKFGMIQSDEVKAGNLKKSSAWEKLPLFDGLSEIWKDEKAREQFLSAFRRS